MNSYAFWLALLEFHLLHHFLLKLPLKYIKITKNIGIFVNYFPNLIDRLELNIIKIYIKYRINRNKLIKLIKFNNKLNKYHKNNHNK